MSGPLNDEDFGGLAYAVGRHVASLSPSLCNLTVEETLEDSVIALGRRAARSRAEAALRRQRGRSAEGGA